MKRYECIKCFTVDSIDESGFTKEEDSILIKTGSTWEIDNTDFRMVGADIRLISDKYGWLEITKETLENNFKTIK